MTEEALKTRVHRLFMEEILREAHTRETQFIARVRTRTLARLEKARDEAAKLKDHFEVAEINCMIAYVENVAHEALFVVRE